MRIRMLAKLCVGVAVLSAGLGSASAQPLEASISMVSDPGDWVGRGESYHYTLDTASFSMRAGQSGGGYFGLSVIPFGGGWWYLDLAAPAGTRLEPGVYEGAVRWPFQNGSQPGVSITGNGAGCNTVTGRFEVLEVVFGPNGYLERFHALFEQHCEGGVPALRGEVRVVNPPPPPPLVMSLSVNDSGRVDKSTGRVTVTGTVTCTITTSVSFGATLTQRLTRFAMARGDGYTSMPCSTTPTAWSLTFQPQGNVPFGNGTGQLMGSAFGYDSYYGNQVTVSANAAIKLTPK